MKNKLCFLLFIAILSCTAQSQSLNIIPEPAQVQMNEGNFIFNSKIDIIYNDAVAANIGKKIIDTFKKRYSINATLADNHPYHNSYKKFYIDYEEAFPQAEGYKLNISDSEIFLTGRGAGLFYGMQTIFQMLPLNSKSSITIPCANIIDSPRFAYRGLHLDCGRHFFSVNFIKQYIDFIAMHKMNTFHWHLTEDQGWRIEIKKYPKLTQVGACRNGTIIGHHPGTGNDNKKDCGYYTQQQIKDIVKYAADCYITIIPEIEMPGHASAAIAAYPKLSCFPDENTHIAKGVKWSGDSTGKNVQQSWGVYPDVFCPSDYTFKFLEDVLDEVLQLFPSKYIHIGGDECPKTYWKESAFCQQLIKDSGLKNEEGLQSYFIQHIEKYLNSKDHLIIGWDEILEGGVAPNATVMSWRGEKGGIEAAKQHHKVIMTPTTYVYFDYAQTKHEDSLTIGGYLPLETVYKYEPLPATLSADEQKYIIGAQANVWSEYLSNPAKIEYMIFPRVDAISEVLWSPKENRNWDDFKSRLQQQFKRYDFLNIRYNTKGIDKGE